MTKRLDTGKADGEVPVLHSTLLMSKEETLYNKAKPYCTE